MVFKLRGWIDWDSTDYAGSLYDLLQEAMTETNFESHVTTYNNYVIDILMVFTGEPQTLRPGFSPPEWKALIIYALPDAPRGRVVQHELSHQFWVEHCGNDCIMNLAKWQLGQVVPDYWSDHCAATINDNKDRFWRWISTGGGGGGPMPCPTLFVWDGSDYIDLGVIDIHADYDVVREVFVATELVGIDNHKAEFLLREGWEGLTYSHSEIDQVKLYAVDSDGDQRLLPLVNATHSELGNVLPRLLLSDDKRVDLYLLETTDLKFVVPYQTDEIQDFVFVIEGCNMYKV